MWPLFEIPWTLLNLSQYFCSSTGVHQPTSNALTVPEKTNDRMRFPSGKLINYSTPSKRMILVLKDIAYYEIKCPISI